MHSPAESLRLNSAAVRVQFNWLSRSKSLTTSQLSQAAASFEADHRLLSASQRIFDARQPAIKKLTGLKGSITAYWKGCTLPYVEDGIRLLPRKRVGAFNDMMKEFADDLSAAVTELIDNYDVLKEEAKNRLGKLYNEGHYPEPSELGDLIKVSWDFPSIEPPFYLAQIDPDLYQQEKERAARRFEEAIDLAQNAFLQEFQTLVANLNERLTPNPDGTKKIFKESSITNLLEFFDKFKALNVTSNEQLESLVYQARELVTGINGKDLRESELLRKDIAEGMQGLSNALAPLVVNAPRRRIIRPRLASTSEVPSQCEAV
jgi:hypothetical protein